MIFLIMFLKPMALEQKKKLVRSKFIVSNAPINSLDGSINFLLDNNS